MPSAVTTAGAGFFQADSSGRQTPTSGTIATSGTTVTGTTTVFNTDIPNTAGVPDKLSFILAGSDPEQIRLVTNVGGETTATIDKAFNPEIASGSSFIVVTMEQLLHVNNVSGPSESANQINVSSYGSSGIAQFVQGLRTPGNWTFTLWFQPKVASHGRFEGRFESGTAFPYLYMYPDSAANTAIPDLSNSRKYGLAFVSGFDEDSPTDGATGKPVTLTLTGNVSTVAGVDP